MLAFQQHLAAFRKLEPPAPARTRQNVNAASTPTSSQGNTRSRPSTSAPMK